MFFTVPGPPLLDSARRWDPSPLTASSWRALTSAFVNVRLPSTPRLWKAARPTRAAAARTSVESMSEVDSGTVVSNVHAAICSRESG